MPIGFALRVKSGSRPHDSSSLAMSRRLLLSAKSWSWAPFTRLVTSVTKASTAAAGLFHDKSWLRRERSGGWAW